MSPHDHVTEGGDQDGGGGDPAHQHPELVRVVQLTVGHLPTHLAPHQARAVCNTGIRQQNINISDFKNYPLGPRRAEAKETGRKVRGQILQP